MNTQLLLQVADQIELHPEEYDQDMWGRRIFDIAGKPTCTSTKCCAGWMVSLRGYKLIFNDGNGNDAFQCQKGGQIFDIEELANELLGVENGSHRLFDSMWMHGHSAQEVADELRFIAYGDRLLPGS